MLCPLKNDSDPEYVRGSPVNVLFVSPEVVPFAKTGGLADVSGALPRYLSEHSCDVRVITPCYSTTKQAGHSVDCIVDYLGAHVGHRMHAAKIWQSHLSGGVPVYLVQCDEYYDRDHLYGNSSGDYPDNAERFIFFCKAAAELCIQTGFRPDVIHCNDWQAGLIPAYLNSIFKTVPFFERTATLFTIHNIGYQGIFSKETFGFTGLPPSYFGIHGVEYWGNICFLKAAIVYADIITTVSPTYSREIQTKEYGCGMEGILADRKNDLYGVLNGADYSVWNPSADALISARYSVKSLWRKRRCKEDLVQRCGLPVEMMSRPLIGMISRLAEQKGFDLVCRAMPALIRTGAGIIILGTGDEKYHRRLRALAGRYPGQLCFIAAYDNGLAHKIEAGCDMFLMPSRYEPCGLNQIYSLRYGTIPVVRATGGLADTITDSTADPEKGNGIVFDTYDSESMTEAVGRAVSLYEQKDRWEKMIRNAMSCDFSWHQSAGQYRDLYELSVRKKRGRADGK